MTRLNLPFSALNCADRERLVPLPQPVLGWRQQTHPGWSGRAPKSSWRRIPAPDRRGGVVYPVARTGRAVGRRGRGERASVRAPISIRDPLARRGGRSARRRPFAGSRQNEHRPRKGENGAPLRYRMLPHAIGRMAAMVGKPTLNDAILNGVHPSGTPAFRMSSIIRSRRFKKSGSSLCAPAR